MAPARQQIIVLKNSTKSIALRRSDYSLSLAQGSWGSKPDDFDFEIGQWFDEPPQVIGPGQIVAFGAQSDGWFRGTQGGIWYTIEQSDPDPIKWTISITFAQTLEHFHYWRRYPEFAR